MRLVVDLDKISSNLNNLNSEVDSFNTNVSSFKSSTIDCNVEEVASILDSFQQEIGNDLDKLTNSSQEFSNLVNECQTEYKKNEESIKSIDINSISNIISNCPDITSGYKSTNAQKLLTNIVLPIFMGNHQANEFYELGDKAYNAYQSDDPAIQEWIEKVGEIVKNTNTYGIKKSLIIAQIINESGWMSSHASSLSDFNNVLGINTDMGRITPDMQDSAWSKKRTSGYNDVTQWDSNGNIIGTNEDMRHYDSIEECIEDYSNVVALYHPDLVGNNDIWAYDEFLSHYTPNPNYPLVNKYAEMIDKFGLEKYDV